MATIRLPQLIVDNFDVPKIIEVSGTCGFEIIESLVSDYPVLTSVLGHQNGQLDGAFLIVNQSRLDDLQQSIPQNSPIQVVVAGVGG